MDSVIIRAACSTDLTEILALYKVLLDEEIQIEKASHTFDRICASDDTFIFVAEIEGAVVGTIQISLSLGMGFDCRPFATVEYLVVNEAYRRNGIGHSLLNQVDIIAEKYNCAFVYLVSSAIHKEAHKLYYSAGFDENVIGFRKAYSEVVV